MAYDAITIDAQTVQHNSFHFDGGLLAQLRQFRDGPVKVVISQVVAGEVLKHLKAKTKEAKDSVESARKKAADYGLPMPGDSPAAVDVKAHSEERLKAFFKEIGAESVSPDLVAMSDVMKLYFQPAPPFSASGKKKNEFPDAVALLSLEAWAKKSGKKILAVSGDGDWKAYGDKSEHIDVVEDLEEALALLQEHSKKAAARVSEFIDAMRSGKAAENLSVFEAKLANEVSGATAYADAESYLHAEANQVELTYISSEFWSPEDAEDITVIYAGDTEIVARLEVEINFRAEADFSFSMYDSIDKDYVPMGSVDAETAQQVEASVLVTFGDDGGDDWTVESVELVDFPDEIQFGYIEPDYGADYHEPFGEE